jgi:hypothetical protein
MCRQIAVLSLFVGILAFSSAGFAGPQVLEVSPTYLEFSAYEDGNNPANQIVSIWNSGHAPMDWTVTPDCNWITLDPNSGTSSGEVDDVNVIVDISGLAAGTYNCQLTVDAGGAVNSPQVVDVKLVIYDPNLVSLWKFDEGSGTTAYDSAGNNDGNIIGDPNWTTGQIDGALSFDGVDDYVNCGNDNSLAITNNLTIAAWVKRTGAGSSNEIIVSKYNGGQHSYRLFFHSTDVVRWWLSKDGGTNNRAYLDSTITITDTNWHFIAATFESGTLKIYIDGVDKTGSGEGNISSIFESTEPLFIGQENSSSYFNGLIDDVRIYDRALSAEEVMAIYAADQPVIGLSAIEFEFTAFEGGANPAEQILGIRNIGIGTLNWEITEDCNWFFRSQCDKQPANRCSFFISWWSGVRSEPISHYSGCHRLRSCGWKHSYSCTRNIHRQRQSGY